MRVRKARIFGSDVNLDKEILSVSTEHHNVDDRQKLDHYTLGLNWYPEQDIILKFNTM